MRNNDGFSALHPAVSFIYFASVLLLSMFLMHPLCLAITLLGAAVYGGWLFGLRRLGKELLLLLPLMAATVLISALFSRQGETVLAHLPGGKPIMLEATVYGVAAASMLCAVFRWFACYNVVVTSDKFVFLFGRVIPALSLVLSMILRLVPRFRKQAAVVADAQRGIHPVSEKETLFRRAKRGMRVFSVLVTWALENGIDTADSMKSRGYGLRGRTAFALYRFDRRSLLWLIVTLAAAGYVTVGAALGALDWSFFPLLLGAPVTAYSASVFAVYLLLCFLPMIVDLWEDRKWTLSVSQI